MECFDVSDEINSALRIVFINISIIIINYVFTFGHFYTRVNQHIVIYTSCLVDHPSQIKLRVFLRSNKVVADKFCGSIDKSRARPVRRRERTVAEMTCDEILELRS